MAASVEKSGTGYKVVINQKTISLPDKNAREVRGKLLIGSDETYLEIDTHANKVVLVENEKRKVIVAELW